jgi:Flp pilus assembly protein TadB
MDGINLWGMLGCAVAYAGALFAAVDGIGDHLIARASATTPGDLHGLRLKTGSKIMAAIITVVTAAVVLVLDNNWIAFAVLTIVFVGFIAWVLGSYRKGSVLDRPR